MFSYGSGSCAEFYCGLIGPDAKQIAADVALVDPHGALALDVLVLANAELVPLVELTTDSLIRAIADQVVFAQASPVAAPVPSMLRRAA